MTFTAVVNPPPSSGYVLFDVDGVEVYVDAVDPVDGTASYGTTHLAAGTHEIVARFQGTADFDASVSEPITQEVMAVDTSTTIEASSATSHPGDLITLTATVSPIPAGGEVWFIRDGVSGASSYVDPVTGEAYITFAATIGDHTYSARFAGYGRWLPSESETIPHSTTKVVTTAELTLSATEIREDEPLSIEVAVSPQPPAGSVLVTFAGDEGAQYEQWIFRNPETGRWEGEVPWYTLAPGGHTVTAEYSGTTRFAESTTAADRLDVTAVDTIPTTTTIDFEPDLVYIGDPMEVTVAVSPIPDAGTVSLWDGSLNQTFTVPVPASGTAVFETTAGAGGYTLIGSYSGSDAHRPSQDSVHVGAASLPWVLITSPVSGDVSGLSAFPVEFRSFTGVSFECRVDADPWTPCTSPWTTPTLTEGDHTVAVRAYDANDRVGEPATLLVPVDLTPPEGSFSINGGAAGTNTGLVLLHLVASDAWTRVNRVRVSNSEALTDGGLLVEAYTTTFPVPDDELSWSLLDPDYGGTSAEGPRTVWVQWRDRAGNWSEPIGQAIHYDLTPPATELTDQRFARGRRVGDGLPVLFAWTVSDTGAGLGRIELERAIRGVWQGASELPRRTRSAVISVPVGTPTQLRVRALDRATNASDWVHGPAFDVTLRSDRAWSLAYRGGWQKVTTADALGGSLRRTTRRGAVVKFTFDGVAAAWIGTTSPRMGRARVYVDGVLMGRVDLHSSARRSRRVVYATPLLVRGRHTLRIVALDREPITLDGMGVMR